MYGVGANEIVTFRPSRPTPNITRWIIRYLNGTYGAALARDIVGSGPGPLPDWPWEELLREITRPGEAQGAGHYTQNSSTATLTGDVLGPSQVGEQPTSEHGLGLVTYNTDGLDFRGLHKLHCWLKLGIAEGM